MASFSNFFPEDVPAADAGGRHNEGDIVVFNDNFYGATATVTLSNPVVATDFDTGWVLLSGGDAAVANAVDDLNSEENITFWTGTQAEYDAIATPDPDTLYYITDTVAVLGTFLGLNDTPGTYGTPGQVPVINADGDGLVFEDQSGGGGGISITSVAFGAFGTPGDPTTGFTASTETHADREGHDVQVICENLIRPLSSGDAATEFRIETDQGSDTYDVITTVTFVNSTTVRFTLPDRTSVIPVHTEETLRLAAVNPDGTNDTFDIIYSDGPEWQTATALGNFAAGDTVNITFDATGATMYDVVDATPSLPAGLSFNSTDPTATLTLTGTVDAMAEANTFAFTVRASDADNDIADRTFCIGVGSSVFGYTLGRSLVNDISTTSEPLFISGRTDNTSEQAISMSFWVKRTGTDVALIASYFRNGSATGKYYSLSFDATGEIRSTFGNSSVQNAVVTTERFNDTSAWYHIFVNYNDSTNVHSVWVNGVQVGSNTAAISGNWFDISTAELAYGHNRYTNASRAGAGYYGRIDFIIGDPTGGSGQAPPVTAFGEFSDEGYWQPVEYTLGHLNNGSHSIPFTEDFSSNTFTDESGNVTVSTQTLGGNTFFSNDTPTNNYSTFSTAGANSGTFSDGARNVRIRSTTHSTFAIKNGERYYVEAPINTSSGMWTYIGYGASRSQTYINSQSGAGSFSAALYVGPGSNISGSLYSDNTSANFTGQSWAATASGFPSNTSEFSNGDIVGMAIDGTARTVQWFKFRGENTITTSSSLRTMGSTSSTTGAPDFGGDIQIIYNQGGSSALPSGAWNWGQVDQTNYNTRLAAVNAATSNTFTAVNTENLADPTSVPQENFGALIYDGNNSAGVNTNRSFTIGFQPDLLIIKNRNQGNSTLFYDSIRNDAFLDSTNSNAQATSLNNNLVSFDTNGWTLSASGRASNRVGDSFVSYAWRAGGSSDTFNIDGTGYATAAAAGLTISQSGSGTPTFLGASINTETGFGIYRVDPENISTTDLCTFSHGLNSTPELVITKTADDTVNWWTFVNVNGGWQYGALNDSRVFNADNLTGTDFATSTSINYEDAFSSSTSNAIIYAWHSVPGYSDFGTYIGNGNADGPFINCGFKPAMVIAKSTSTAHNWSIQDNARDPFNPVNSRLNLNTAGSEFTGFDIFDFYANGFKVTTNDNEWNRSGTTYIYMAFAESPFKYSLGR